MGDRVNVEVFILARDTSRFEQISDFYEYDYKEMEDGDMLGRYGYDDVNYGDTGFEKALQEARIPYEKNWTEGGEFPAGSEEFRVHADGTTTLKETNDDTGKIPMEDLEKAVNIGFDSVKKLLLTARQEAYVLPWREQEAICERLSESVGE